MLENKLANLQRLLSDSLEAVEDNTQVNNITVISYSTVVPKKKTIVELDLGVLYTQIPYLSKIGITMKRNKPHRKKD